MDYDLLFVLMFQRFGLIIVTLEIPVHEIILQPDYILDVIHLLPDIHIQSYT